MKRKAKELQEQLEISKTFSAAFKKSMIEYEVRALQAEARLAEARADWVDDPACHDRMCSYRAEAHRIPELEARAEKAEQSLAEAVREDPEKFSFDTLLLVGDALLAHIYPARTFGGEGDEIRPDQDPGVQLIIALRKNRALLNTPERSEGDNPSSSVSHKEGVEDGTG